MASVEGVLNLPRESGLLSDEDRSVVRSGATDGWSGLTDAELLVGIADGNQQAFSVLVNRHFDLAYRVAWRVMGGPGDAEDVAQEAFVKLWQAPEKIRDGQAAKAWLMRVVTNLAIDRMRRRKPEYVAEPPDMADLGLDPEEEIQRQDLSQRVDGAISSLPERQRIALILTYFEGQGNQAVAEAMDTSVEAVESLLARARRSLKVTLAGDWRGMLEELDALG